MDNDPKRAIAQLQGQIEKDLDSLNAELIKELKAQTPVDTGRAKRGWRKSANVTLKSNADILATNQVPYIGPLDKGHSKQAPNGIVEPALKKVFRRNR